MQPLVLQSYLNGQWIDPGPDATTILSAIDGTPVARAGGSVLDFGAALDFARNTGGPALRDLTFHDRARILKGLAIYLDGRKEELYALSTKTGATRADSWIDIDGGIGTVFVFASKGRREMPDGHAYLDGEVEQLSRDGTFLGQHICTPLLGAAIQINAFNFPVWGMLEKFAPAFLGGVPSIVKPATTTAYVAEAAVRMMLESDLLPKGALQLVTGRTGDLLNRLTAQDVVSFTGSAETALKLRATPELLRNATRFIAEQDSLNASILGPDAGCGTPEFDLFVKEVSREISTKAGQKCTAIRRIIVPDAIVADVTEALKERLESIVIGDPAHEATRMGALVSLDQRRDVAAKAGRIGTEAQCVTGDQPLRLDTADPDRGAFMAPRLYLCANPDDARIVHETEAFGPVSTLMGYRDISHSIDIANRGGGSLVASLITHDPNIARDVTLGIGAWHGRVYINDRTAMKESTGHGSPLPHMVHGGPGRAGGGEELGGIRGVKHYMQRTAVQGSPDMLTAITGIWTRGAETRDPGVHPFRKSFETIEIGDSILTDPRTITMEDIEHFAHFTGDTFYAHLDEDAARSNPFFPGRVAHGYLILSFAAGLFVDPAPGPVLANTGLNGLAFKTPVVPGDTIRVRLTAQRKTKRTDEYGEVRWHAHVTNQTDEDVAEYELLTMVAFAGS